jgi:Carboxypeptidase regulatory-like domain
MEEAMRVRLFKISMSLFLSSVLLMTIVQTAGAQDVYGRISGTVTDPTGAVVPKAKVTITNEATKVKRVAETDETGFFVAPNLLVTA